MDVGRLLRFRLKDWALPLALAGGLMVLHAALPDAAGLRYEREGILGGEAWRLLTGHLVHADAAHLAWNLLGVLIVWFLFAGDFKPVQWLWILVLSTVAVDLGFLMVERDLEWYVGFSGVLHGCMAAGLVAWLRTTRDPVTWLVVLLFAAKLAWEHFMGALPFTAGSLSLPVVHEAHSYGAIGGAFAGLILGRKAQCGAASL
jgi:rhomboid family GlyGly-CTERM serine protease